MKWEENGIKASNSSLAPEECEKQEIKNKKRPLVELCMGAAAVVGSLLKGQSLKCHYCFRLKIMTNIVFVIFHTFRSLVDYGPQM